MYFFTTNLKTKRFNKKFNHIKIESFFIEKIRKSINYKLQLSSNIKIHSMFHVSLLKLVDFNTLMQITFHYEFKKKNKFEIKRILKRKNQNYFIKWKEYFISENTWKSFKNFENCQQLLRKFQNPKKQQFNFFNHRKEQVSLKKHQSKEWNWKKN